MSTKEKIICVVIIIGLVIVDQITKAVVFNIWKEGDESKCIPGLFRFALTYNKGGAFGILQGKTMLFLLITVLGLGAFIYLLSKADFNNQPLYTAGLLLVIGGTIGNSIDRLLMMIHKSNIEGVRDFITFDFFTFPSFNFADMCLTCGMILLIIGIIFPMSDALGKELS